MSPESKPFLRIIDGPQFVHSIPINRSPFTIGCDESCNFLTTSPGVSHVHCRFLKKNNRWYAYDLNSCNGTYVDGQLITEGTELNHKSRIHIGTYCFEFRLPVGSRPAEKVLKQSQTYREVEEQASSKRLIIASLIALSLLLMIGTPLVIKLSQ